MMHFSHKGLTTTEALRLQKRYGFNSVEEDTTSFFLLFLKKFVSPIPLMIEFALLLSAIVRRWEDFFIILILLTVNIAVDVIQEHKAKKALAILTKVMAETAIVLRDGKLQEIEADQLVPGDVIKLSIGDITPADVKLLDKTTLTVDQSSITGESMPIEKNFDDQIPSSAIIQQGSGYAVITKTGADTTIGNTASLVDKARREESSHFQAAILRIGHFLIIIALCLIVISSAVLIVRGESLAETLRFAIVLTIASIPVALPAVLSVTMAIGANMLAKRKAIVSDFQAVEELAGINHLCVDKTGTLTKNSIEAFSPTLYNSFTEQDWYTYALFALEDSLETPIEKALFTHAHTRKYDKSQSEYTLESFTPFNPSRKTTEATIASKRERLYISLGAPQVIAQLIKKTDPNINIEKDVEKYATKGFRSIALAIKQDTDDSYRAVGIVPLMDPARDDSKSVIHDIHKRGITIKMLTGDNHSIASFIAKQLHIGTRVLSSHKLNSTPAQNLDQAIAEADVFTEVTPADKYNIVSSLQEDGHIVAMTGDGVNDAPALKKADVGIAVKNSTAAARKASDLVLLEASLSVIKDAIDQARQTFARMQSYATFRISETIRIVFFVALSLIVFEHSPVSSVMIILLALLNDIPVLAISYDNVKTSKKPLRWNFREMLTIATALGLLGVISSFLLFYYLNISGVPLAVIQTIIFLKLDVAGHSTLYLTRTGRHHFWERPFPSLKFFLPAFSSRLIGTILVYFGVLMPAIDLKTIGLVWLYATIWFVVNDFIKVCLYKLLDRRKA